MQKIRLDEVKNLYEYEKVREGFRREVIAAKARRRIPVGDRLSFVFENRQTVLFQIQEMVRAERIVADARIQDEIDVYNDLIPGPGELSATLFIEIEDASNALSLYATVHPDAAVRAAAEDCDQKFTTVNTDLFQNEKLYARLKAAKPANPRQEKLQRDLLQGFEDSGVSLPPDKRDAAYAEEMQKRYPKYAEAFVASRFMDWPATPWTRASYSFAAPGEVTTMGPILRKGIEGRLHFAGEHTCYKFAGYMEGALNSGLSVARRLATRDGIVARGG